MFTTPDVWMVFKSAKLMTTEIDGREMRMAECQFVLDPFKTELAHELGESIAVHLYDEAGALRPELTTITLDPRVPPQRMQARGAEGVPGTTMETVEILSLTCARIVDEKSMQEWIKATVRARFDFAPKGHREWIAMYFGLGFYATFEVEQMDLLDREADAGVMRAVRNMQRRLKDSGSIELTGPDGSGVRITADTVEQIEGTEPGQ